MRIGAVLIGTILIATGRMPAGAYEAPLDVRKSPEVKFTAEPKAEAAGDRVKITFALSGPADVEVAILDGGDKAVRHLAAGLLGKNAPPPFQKDALSQEILWDRRDDSGKPVGAIPLKIRVRAGAQPRAERTLGWNGQTMGPIRALTVGAGGEVYVVIGSWVHQGRVELRALDRNGVYLRTVMPYPAATPAQRTKSVGQLEIEGDPMPVVFSGHAHALSPLTVALPRQNLAWNPKGHIVAASTLATAYEHGLPRHLLALHPQGGAPEGVSFVGPELRPPTGITWGHGEGDDPCFEHLAVSPDGKWIYYTSSTFYSPHCVFRLAWGEDHGSGVEAGWFGEENRPGSDDLRLNSPEGLAVDAQGRVYICDRGNNRVVIVSPDARTVGSFPVESPEQVAVHPKTGEIFVFSRQLPPGGKPKDTGPMSMPEYKAWKARVAERTARLPSRQPSKLLKFAAWGGAAPRQLASLDTGLDLMALDPESSPARLWASSKNGLIPIDDKGATLEPGRPVDGGDGLLHPGYVAGDPDRNRVLLYPLSSNFKVFSLDMTTGAKSLLVEGVSDFAVAPDGSIYGTGKFNSNELLHFGPDGKPAPFAGAATHVVKTGPLWVGGVNLGARGMAVSPAGDIYVMRAANERAVQSRVDVYGPDGKLKKAAIVDGLGIGDCGIGVDAANNIYLGVNVKPKDRLYPDEFKGKIPESNWLCWAQWNWHYRPPPWYYSMRNEYLYHWGAVAKFGPAGGAFYGRGNTEYESAQNAADAARVENAPAGAAEYMSGYLYNRVKATGLQWRYPGMGIVPSSERQWGDPACVCMGSRLSVDRYGRVFMPNCFRFCVEVLDSAGNRLLRVGRYGNADDGRQSRIADLGLRNAATAAQHRSAVQEDPQSEIRNPQSEMYFAWPAFVSAAGDRLFVSDSVNRRVSVIAFDYAAAAEAPVN